jgi:UDP-hydrolysing UDP-N-acetyl-D-glucosamine 2-epimerase
MSSRPRRVAVVTGTRAEFGLLVPVIEAIDARADLRRELLVTGAHLLPPDPTVDEVARRFAIDATIPMQTPGAAGRHADAAALGRGVTGFAARFADAPPDVVVVLGDRIEAFAAAAAAAVGGIRVAHLHGGDRAEGIADEALRHAITKLAHVHCPATAASAKRIAAMGEEANRVHVTGSPAIDGLDRIEPLADQRLDELGRPALVVLLHPVGRSRAVERAAAAALLSACCAHAPTLALHPNHDPGREGILDAIEASGCRHLAHLERRELIGLLRRVRAIVGNSSAGLIEAAALGVPAINVGRRQDGRERPGRVVDLAEDDLDRLGAVLDEIGGRHAAPADHPYGDGTAGRRIAEVLATFDEEVHGLRKRNTY